MELQVKFVAAFTCAIFAFMCALEPCDGRSKKVRLTIPKSLLVVDSEGLDVIQDACELTKKASKSSKPVFMDDNHFIKRVAMAETSLNRTSKEGGLWNVDECAFKATQTKRRENKQLAALHKTVRRTFGVTWSKIKYSDLRRPLYSVLAARIVLEMTERSIPRGLRNQARLWLETYHECAEKPGDPKAWEQMKTKFMRGIFVYSFLFISTFLLVFSFSSLREIADVQRYFECESFQKQQKSLAVTGIFQPETQ